MKSLRNQDMRAEEKLGEFMDEYFYSRLESKSDSPLTFERMKDRESQLRGIDVLLKINDRTMIIDEKASIYYSNAMIPTFAFELDSIQKGHSEAVQGWFVNDELETEYYMLIWPNIKCVKQDKQWVRKDIDKLQKSDFTILEAYLVPKMSIRMLLEKQGYDKNNLSAYAKEYRKVCMGRETRQETILNENVKITFSGHIPEKPINVVIKKSLLKELAKGIYLISADGYATIKGD